MTIEELKKNTTPIGLLSEEDVEILKKVGWRNRELWGSIQGKWLSDGSERMPPELVFRIKDSYKEPKFVECKVYIDQLDGLLAYEFDRKRCWIHDAVDNPKFTGYKYKNGIVRVCPRLLDDEKPAETPTHVVFKQ